MQILKTRAATKSLKMNQNHYLTDQNQKENYI